MDEQKVWFDDITFGWRVKPNADIGTENCEKINTVASAV